MKLPNCGYTTSHPDFHLPDSAEVGGGFNAEKYLAALKEGQVDVVYFFAKCHYGNSYYDTKVGHRHPGLKKDLDLLREITRVCHQGGIRVVAYFSGGVDTYAARQHPDWRMAGKNGPPAAIPKDADVFANVCMLSPYADEWLLPQMVEVARCYDVDGVMTDTMCDDFLCYCEHCRKQYLADTGKTMPIEDAGKDWADFCRWRFQRKEAFIDKICRGVHQVKPDLPVAFNWVYSMKDPTPPNPAIGYLVADISMDKGQLEMLTRTARYFAGTGLPFEVMTGRFMHGLGDWSIKPIEMLKQGMVTVAANGGRCTLIDRQIPDGNLDPIYYQRLKSVFGFIHERQAVFEDAVPMRQTAILHSASSLFGPNMELYSASLRRDKPIQGACLAMVELLKHFTIINEWNLAERLAGYETVILPEQYALPLPALECLKEYIRNGGTVIASHPAGFEGDRRLWSDVFGIELQGEYPYAWCYAVHPASDKHEYANAPIPIHGACAKLQPQGAGILADLHEPMASGRFTRGEAPPRIEASSPAVTLNAYGKGRAVYIAGPLFASLRDYYNPAAIYLLRKIWEVLVPEPLLDVRSDSELEVSLASQPGKVNVHIINRNGERKIDARPERFSWVAGWPVTQVIRPTGKLRIQLRLKAKPVWVKRLPENEDIPFSYKNGVLDCEFSDVHIHTCMQVSVRK